MNVDLGVGVGISDGVVAGQEGEQQSPEGRILNISV